MIGKEVDIVSLLERAFQGKTSEEFDEIGTVVCVGDGIARIYGLVSAVFGELVLFEGGNKGIILDLDEDFASVVLLDPGKVVLEKEVVSRTGSVFKVPVGAGVLGRVVNAACAPIDGLGDIVAEDYFPVERQAPGIMDRKPVSRPFETGILAIDTLIPIGRGQRELLLGGRSTGKSTIAIDSILHQKGKDIYCIYVSIGRKQSDIAKLMRTLEEHGALEYTTIVAANANDSALNQFLSPYVGCTLGEYFMDQGKDVFIVYDDLSNHAVAYRELSLLLRKPPGREAYPGDIFYIHSRLLERAAQLSDEKGGGSLTALPIAQLQGEDLAAYIPTNLISITDGQILLDINLFNQGIRPAVNVGLSVSRVGGAAQTPIIKKLAGQLKLELAQYDDLQAFMQFGSELDKHSKQKLDRGQRAIEVLKQQQRVLYSFADQALFLFLLKKGFLDSFKLASVQDVMKKFASFVKEMHRPLYKRILEQAVLSDKDSEILEVVAQEFCLVFMQ